MNDRDRCIANLYALAKRKGLKIGDLETSCGVSVGYLARLRQDKKKPLPGSDFLFRAAALLDTSVDALMYFDFPLASGADQYLHTFISKLTMDTLTEKLAWSPDPGCIPNPVILDEIAFPDHPLLTLNAELLQQGKSKEQYSSPFRPAAYNLVPRAAWRASISEDTVVLLTQVSPDLDDSAETAGLETEMYLYHTNTKALSMLCHSTGEHPGPLDHDLSVLCSTVSESLHQTVLDRSAVRAIDAYLQNGRTE